MYAKFLNFHEMYANFLNFHPNDQYMGSVVASNSCQTNAVSMFERILNF